MGRRVILVDTDETFRISAAAVLRRQGYDVEEFAEPYRAVEALQDRRFDLLVLDLCMSGSDGLAVLGATRLWGSRIPVLALSGFGNMDAAVRGVHLGADDVLTKPMEFDALLARVAELVDRDPDRDLLLAHSFEGMVGRSYPMREVFEMIRGVARTETNILIEGEPGTGKELAGRAIHLRSGRKSAAFVVVQCATLTEQRFEDVLFGPGHPEPGTATGTAKGAFEIATGGTLFLEEVADLSPPLQRRLLWVLKECERRRTRSPGDGSPIDVRIVASTSRDLRRDVERGTFRAELLYRLRGFTLPLPPLRDRPEDVPLLVEAGLRRWRTGEGPRRGSGSIYREHCTEGALRRLRRYAWPGNVRELFAAVESASILSKGERIEVEHLPPAIRRESEMTVRDGTPGPETERRAILAALRTAGNRTRAAKLLRMSRTTLYRKMVLHDIGRDREAAGLQ
jgi:two-component system, NtrC family, response regulator HydG